MPESLRFQNSKCTIIVFNEYFSATMGESYTLRPNDRLSFSYRWKYRKLFENDRIHSANDRRLSVNFL